MLTKAYGLSASSINLTYSVNLLATLVMGIPSNFIINRIGFRNACLLSGLIMTLGSALRLTVNFNLNGVYVGQALLGTAGPLVQNSIFFYAHHTFAKESAPVGLAVISLMNPIGTMIGFLLPYAFINTNDSSDNIKTQNFLYMLVEFGLSGALFLFSIFGLPKAHKEKAEVNQATIASSPSEEK